MFESIFFSGINPLIVTLAVIVIGVPMLLSSILSIMPKGNDMKQGLQKVDDISHDERDSLIEKVHQVYSTFNLKAVQSITTEMFYATITCTCKILQHVGVRRVVEFDLDQQRDKLAPTPLSWTDGKNSGLTDVAYGSYIERYQDSSSDKVYYEKKWPKTMLMLTTIKSNLSNGQTPRFCTQCGSPISLSGDFYHCQHCGAHYQSDAYRWTVTAVKPENEKKGNFQTKLITFWVFGTILLSSICTFTSSWPLHLLTYLMDAGMAFVLVWLIVMKKKIRGVIECQKYDKLFSRLTFQRRVEYLYRLYREASDLDITLVKPFIESDSYAKLEEKNKLDEYYFIDYEFQKFFTPSFTIKDGKQWMDSYLYVLEVTMNEKKKVKKKKQKIHMVLVRDEQCKTEPKNGAELYTCENCGASINLAQDGLCKYCGGKVDLLKHDWCLHTFEEV